MNASQHKDRSEKDRDLAARVASGDLKAQRALFNRFHKVALSTALNSIDDPQEAEDIAIDAILKVIEKLIHGEVLVKSSIGSFLITMIKRSARDMREKSKAIKRGGGVRALSLDTLATEMREAPFLQDEDLSGFDAFESRDGQEYADQLVDNITDPVTRAVARIELSGYKPKHIEEALGLSYRQLRAYQYRYKRDLKLIFEKEQERRLGNLFEQIEPRLEDLQLLFQKLTRGFKPYANDLDFILGIIYGILLPKLPNDDAISVMHFKSEILLFVFELLVNKGLLRGPAGALHFIPQVLDACQSAGNREGLIRVKNAECIAWRVLRQYDPALKAALDAKDLAANLTDPAKKRMFKHRTMGDQGRVYGYAGAPELARRMIVRSLHFLEDSGDIERAMVKHVDLAEVLLQFKGFDEAIENLDIVRDWVPDTFVNLRVKYHKTLAGLFFLTNDNANGIAQVREAWQLTDSQVLRNQFRDLLQLLSAHNLDAREALTQAEIDRGLSVIQMH